MTNVQAIRCPCCGAPYRHPFDGECEYCHSFLTGIGQPEKAQPIFEFNSPYPVGYAQTMSSSSSYIASTGYEIRYR